MTVIFIRHGKDKKSSHKYDEKLRKSAKKEAYRLAKELIGEHGMPDIIYYSPYVRTRQTLKYMHKFIKKHRKRNGIKEKPLLKVEPKLSRFFTSKERKNPDIRESTLNKGVIIVESKKEFKNRVSSHLEEVIDKAKQDKLKIWNITHGLVLVNVAEAKNIKLPKHLNYLERIVIES